MALDPNDKRVQLAVLFGEAIFRYTQAKPMTIEEIIEALTFTAGHALSQKGAQQFSTKKRLREVAIASLDRGINEGAIDRSGAQLILPPTLTN